MIFFPFIRTANKRGDFAFALTAPKAGVAARVSTEFRRHGIPRNFLTSEVISAQFRRNSAEFRRNWAGNHFRIPRNAKMSLPWTP